MTLATVETEFLNQNGDVVTRRTDTLIETGGTTDATPIPSAPFLLERGDEMPAVSIGTVTRTDFVRYAGAGGDLNPIHHDEPLAVSAGLPSVFGMGMFPAGLLGAGSHAGSDPKTFTPSPYASPAASGRATSALSGAWSKPLSPGQHVSR